MLAKWMRCAWLGRKRKTTHRAHLSPKPKEKKKKTHIIISNRKWEWYTCCFRQFIEFSFGRFLPFLPLPMIPQKRFSFIRFVLPQFLQYSLAFCRVFVARCVFFFSPVFLFNIFMWLFLCFGFSFIFFSSFPFPCTHFWLSRKSSFHFFVLRVRARFCLLWF